MKKFILICTLFISLFSFAQQVPSAFTQLAELSQKQAENLLFTEFKKLIPEDKMAEFNKDIQPKMYSLTKKIEDVFREVYTEKEAEELLKFYQTPIGKKSLEVTPIILNKTIEKTQEWGEEVHSIIIKYMN